MTPTEEDLKRDLIADLALCEEAVPDGFELGATMNPDPEPGEGDFWHVRTAFHRSVPRETAERYLRWRVASREGWSAAIRRAIAAEAEVARLQAVIDGMAQRIVDQSELLSRKAEKR